MDVAEDPHNPISPEEDGAAGAGRIQAYVKNLAIMVRKCVVEYWVSIREIDEAASQDRQDMRRKALVLLQHLVVFRLFETIACPFLAACCRFDPDHRS